MFVTQIKPEWEQIVLPDGMKIYCWRIRPEWENTGDTPTRGLRIYTDGILTTELLPDNHDIRTAIVPEGTGLSPPHSKMQGGPFPRFGTPSLTPDELIKVREGNAFLYIWGWAKYRDVFRGTPEHITRFCFRINVLGDPYAFSPAAPHQGGFGFNYLHHGSDNAIDEDAT